MPGGDTFRSWDFAKLELRKEILRGGHKKVGGVLSDLAENVLMTPLLALSEGGARIGLKMSTEMEPFWIPRKCEI